MNRRLAIKNLSLALGFTIASPALVSILSSCNNNEFDWNPIFLNDTEKVLIEFLVDIILPKSDTPGGAELNTTQFIDKIASNVLDKNEQSIFNMGSKLFANKFEVLFNKNVLKADKKEINFLLDRYFKLPETDEKRVLNLLKSNFSEVPEQEKELFLIYKFLTLVRNYSMLCYYTSSQILEDVMDYKSTPGTYSSCIDISKTKG